MTKLFKSAASVTFVASIGLFLAGCQNVTTSATSTHAPIASNSSALGVDERREKWRERVASMRERQQAFILKARERRQAAVEKRRIESEKRKTAADKRREEARKRLAARMNAGENKPDNNQTKINRAFAKASDEKNDSLRVGWVRVDGKFVYRSRKDVEEIKKAAKKKAQRKARRQAVPKGNYSKLIAKYAAQHGVPYRLARAVVFVESSYRPNVTGAAGEIGLMQIRLSTARGMGYKGSAKQLYNPATNLYWGMKYLGQAHRLAGGSTCGTILKYNAGHGAKRMNPISQRYCNRVSRII